MSTRSIIGTATDGCFTGRYAHWDGYPEAKVVQLLETYADLGSWEAVRDYAIKPQEKGYWSSFGSPSYVAEVAALPELVPCTYCTDDPGYRTWNDGRHPCNVCVGSGHPVGQQSNSARTSTWVATGDDTLVDSTTDVGAEWAYLLDENGINVVAFLREDGSKAVGAFGSIGDGYWASSGFIKWDTDPAAIDFEHLECGPDLEQCCHLAYKHFPDAPMTVGTDTWLRRRNPHMSEVVRVHDTRLNRTYVLNGSGGTGTARDPHAWNAPSTRPRYWWARAKDSATGIERELRVFRITKSGAKVEPRFHAYVPTQDGDLAFGPGSVLS